MSDKDENTESPDSKVTEAEDKPLEVIVKNKDEKKWNDSHDNNENDEIILTKEDMDI